MTRKCNQIERSMQGSTAIIGKRNGLPETLNRTE